MIDSITISNVATYATTPEEISGLSQFNFFFGSNGTGKTTISRVIAEESKFPKCNVSCKSGTKLQPLVYNGDFVEKNFNQSAELKGVFTLGEKHGDIIAKIATAKGELDAIGARIATLTNTLKGEDGNGGKQAELATLEAGFKEKCWAQKQKHDTKLQGGFEGCRANSEKFKSKVLLENATNAAPLLPLAELEKKAEVVFGPTPTNEAAIPVADSSTLLSYETSPILNVDFRLKLTRLFHSNLTHPIVA